MLPRECLWVVERVRTQVLVQGADGLHVIVGEREGHDVQILLEVVGLGAGDGNQVALHNPSEHDLRCRLFAKPSVRSAEPSLPVASKFRLQSGGFQSRC